MSETATVTLHPTLDRIQRPALIIGIIGLAGCAVGLALQSTREQFFRSYLFGYMFWIGLALGCYAILMLQHLTGGNWALAIRRILEAGSRMIPFMALLFIPILLPIGMHSLYEWSHSEHHAQLHGFKATWLQPWFFILRAVVYFVIWLVYAFLLNRWSVEQDRTGDIRAARKLQIISGPGLLIYGLSVTFASIDWVMSIDPHWYSHIWGILFIVGQGLSTFAFCIAILSLLAKRNPLESIAGPGTFHDLGNLLFAFTMLWAYVQYSQLLIIWMGNLAEDVPFYVYRIHKGWLGVSAVLIAFHFFVPFLILLDRRTKRTSGRLATVAIWIMVMRLVDLFWMTRPMFYQLGPIENAPGLAASIHWLDFAAPLGIGGIWIALFIGQLRRRPLLPPNDPRLLEAAHSHGSH